MNEKCQMLECQVPRLGTTYGVKYQVTAKNLTPDAGEPKTESGQAIVLFAIVLAVTTLFALGIIDYMVTNTRVMETLAAADLAAHAGVQTIVIEPDGGLDTESGQAQNVVISYFGAQSPDGAALGSVQCALIEARPACQVTASVQSAGILIPKRWITVSTVGFLAYGVTEDDQ